MAKTPSARVVSQQLALPLKAVSLEVSVLTSTLIPTPRARARKNKVVRPTRPCTRRRYATFRSVHNAWRHIRARWGTRADELMFTPCPTCAGWHLTR
jgi:hypothetical protein